MVVHFSFYFLPELAEGLRRAWDPNRLRGPGLFAWRVRQRWEQHSFVCRHSSTFTSTPVLFTPTQHWFYWLSAAVWLDSPPQVHVNRKRIQTALVCLCRTSGFVFWSSSYGLVRPTVPGSSAREMLMKVPSSSSTSASMARVFVLSTVFFWVSDDHSSMSKMSKMSHSSHHSLLFLLFLLSHSLTPAAWIIHVSSFPTWQVAQVTLLLWQPASQNRRLATPQGKLSGVKVWVLVKGSHKENIYTNMQPQPLTH